MNNITNNHNGVIEVEVTTEPTIVPCTSGYNYHIEVKGSDVTVEAQDLGDWQPMVGGSIAGESSVSLISTSSSDYIRLTSAGTSLVKIVLIRKY